MWTFYKVPEVQTCNERPRRWGWSTLRKQGGGHGQGPEGPALRDPSFLGLDFCATVAALKDPSFLGPNLDLGLRPWPGEVRTSGHRKDDSLRKMTRRAKRAGEFCNFEPAAKTISFRKMTRRTNRAVDIPAEVRGGGGVLINESMVHPKLRNPARNL